MAVSDVIPPIISHPARYPPNKIKQPPTISKISEGNKITGMCLDSHQNLNLEYWSFIFS